MQVIYIAGASHSGSTLLDMMLNAHPDIIGVGELLHINRVLYSKSGKVKATRCSCGAVGLLQCEFWSGVNQRIEETTGKPMAELNVNDYRRGKGEHEANSVVFRAISDVSGKKFIVDSSKIPRRLQYLLQVEELNVYPIHLLRKPAGQIASVISQYGLVKSIFYHEAVHAQFRQMLKAIPHSVVWYEDLVADPKGTLQRILAPAGLAFDPRQLSWAEQARHSFAGNHARLQTKSELVMDQKWNDILTPTQKLLIKLGTFTSMHLSPKAKVTER